MFIATHRISYDLKSTQIKHNIQGMLISVEYARYLYDSSAVKLLYMYFINTDDCTITNTMMAGIVLFCKNLS